MLACGPAEPSPVSVQLGHTYWALELNHHAVLLSTTVPWDTLSLMGTPLNHLGQPLLNLAAPQYSSADVRHVMVTPDGVLHAIAPLAENQEVLVTARLTMGGVTHVDTVYVRVMDTPNPPPVLHSLSIHPLPPDTAKEAVGPDVFLFTRPPLVARSADSSGAPLANLPVYFRSSDPRAASVDRLTGVVTSAQMGPVTFYASTTAFGVTKADTLPYRIGWPVQGNIRFRVSC